MGDFRADIKIKVTSLGKIYKMDSYLNYWPDSEYNGVDQRVLDFFRKMWDDVKIRHDEIVNKYFAEQEAKNKKEFELTELKRLKEKYE